MISFGTSLPERRESHPISFSLKSAKDLDCVDVGMPLFESVTRDPEIKGFNPAIKGFVPNQDDFDGVTPLCAAAEAGAARTVCLLVEAMADTERTGQRQRTPLHLAAQGGRDFVVKLLLEASASTNTADVYGRTALHVAACNNFSRQVALGAPAPCSGEPKRSMVFSRFAIFASGSLRNCR